MVYILRTGEIKKANKILFWKSEGNRQFGRARRGRKDYIKMAINNWGVRDCIRLKM